MDSNLDREPLTLLRQITVHPGVRIIAGQITGDNGQVFACWAEALEYKRSNAERIWIDLFGVRWPAPDSEPLT